jgi:hypothetical protein
MIFNKKNIYRIVDENYRRKILSLNIRNDQIGNKFLFFPSLIFNSTLIYLFLLVLLILVHELVTVTNHNNVSLFLSNNKVQLVA